MNRFLLAAPLSKFDVEILAPQLFQHIKICIHTPFFFARLARYEQSLACRLQDSNLQPVRLTIEWEISWTPISLLLIICNNQWIDEMDWFSFDDFCHYSHAQYEAIAAIPGSKRMSLLAPTCETWMSIQACFFSWKKWWCNIYQVDSTSTSFAVQVQLLIFLYIKIIQSTANV